MEKIESMRSQKLHPRPLEDCTEDCKERYWETVHVLKKER